MAKCKATTKRLNCGCCNEIVLNCILESGHPGMHEDDSLREWDYLRVLWEPTDPPTLRELAERATA